MLGSSNLTAILGAAPPADADTIRLKDFARQATRAGLALLLLKPYTKIPVDLRSALQITREDRAAREIAKDAGRPDWERVRSLAGAHLATTDEKVICRYIDKYRKVYESDYDDRAPINFAMELGRSRLVVVDCDTAAQVDAFMRDSGINPPIPPTVRTPGTVDENGNWAHKDGGHYYFTLPDDLELPPMLGSMTMPGEYVIYWRDRYILIPPSIRQEGPYIWSGREYPLPIWIEEQISGAAARRIQRMERSSSENSDDSMTDAVDSWSQSVSWDSLLAPLGWVKTARLDRCGCDVYTAPGDHGSPKSATAHDTGCALGRYTEINAPLHIWTDNPGPGFEEWVRERGTKTITKLQTAAIANFNGDMAAACTELGVLPTNEGNHIDLEAGVDVEGISADDGLDKRNLDEPLGGTVEFTGPGGTHTVPYSADEAQMHKAMTADTIPAFDEKDADEAHRAADMGEAVITNAVGHTVESIHTEDGVYRDEDPAVPDIAPFNYWRDLPAPEYAIEGLIEQGALSCMIGPPGVGKTAVAIDMACSLVMGQPWQTRKTIKQRVLYLPGEGLSGAVQRIKAWELAHQLDVGQDLMLGNAIIQLGASNPSWHKLVGYILKHRVGMIIFDTFARMSLGLEENSATDVGRAIRRFDQIRKLTGAGVMVIHHTGKTSMSGRGSNALNGALDSELLITPGEWDSSAFGDGYEAIEMTTSKQKNAPRLKDPLPLMLSPMHDSVVVTGPTGQVGDPFDTTHVLPMLMAEPLVELAIRLQVHARRFPAQGVTRGEFVRDVVVDHYTASRRDSELRWKRNVAEAVDLGMRFGLIETVTQRPTGSRYVAGGMTADQARIRAAEEALD